MSGDGKPEIGSIGWIDLTVEKAEEVRAFYGAVVGWETEAVDMGGYSDFNMKGPESGKPMAGVCHARGGNAGLPAQWMIYITVADADVAAARCLELGGKVVAGPKDMAGYGRYCVVEDPAGAVSALFAPSS
jgi:predicted enzyme related to lactoylglutathione lyase